MYEKLNNRWNNKQHKKDNMSNKWILQQTCTKAWTMFKILYRKEDMERSTDNLC